MTTLLLGMGNPILGDDAVGIRVAQHLSRRLGPVPGLTIREECCAGGLELLEVVEGFDRLIVLDSIKTREGRPGDWYRFDGDALRETMHLNNVHDANFATAMELGRQLGGHVPRDEDIHVLAVEISDNLTFSDHLSPELQDAMPELVDEMRGEILALLDTTFREGSRSQASVVDESTT
ncbi:MAG TPA: hydrogenase maturation protease [Thermoleophilia bacterium]|nr:hydrogenase maturation protease [Thermoleophilia bacterium]